MFWELIPTQRTSKGTKVPIYVLCFSSKVSILSIFRYTVKPVCSVPQYSVNPPTRSTNSYPALQIFTCYRVSPVTLPDFGGPDGGTISELGCNVNSVILYPCNAECKKVTGIIDQFLCSSKVFN